MPGHPLSRTFALNVLDDGLLEEDEVFELVLTSLSVAIIGDDDRLTVTIADDDWTTLTLSVSDVDEDAGAAELDLIYRKLKYQNHPQLQKVCHRG